MTTWTREWILSESDRHPVLGGIEASAALGRKWNADGTTTFRYTGKGFDERRLYVRHTFSQFRRCIPLTLLELFVAADQLQADLENQLWTQSMRYLERNCRKEPEDQ
jgi:hypothetical protein